MGCAPLAFRVPLKSFFFFCPLSPLSGLPLPAPSHLQEAGLKTIQLLRENSGQRKKTEEMRSIAAGVKKAARMALRKKAGRDGADVASGADAGAAVASALDALPDSHFTGKLPVFLLRLERFASSYPPRVPYR